MTTTRYSYIDYDVSTATGSGTIDLSYGGSGEAPIQLIDDDVLLHELQLEIIRTRSDVETTLTLTTEYTVDPNTSLVQIVDNGSLVVNGDKIRIQRSLKEAARYVTWVSTILEASQHNFDSDHCFFLVQEALDLSRDALRKGTNGQWNGETLRSYNCGPATTNDGWTTLSQVSNLLAGAETATISDTSLWTLADTGTAIQLTDFEGSLSVEDVYVHINGVMQEPDGVAYTISGTNPPTVTLNTGLTTGETAYVRLIEGTVAAVISSNTIQGSAIVNDTIDESKFQFTGTGNDRFLVIDTNGQPTVQTIDHTKISDFDAGVRANRLNEIAAPDGTVNMNAQVLSNLAASVDSNDAMRRDEIITRIDAVGTAPEFKSYTSQSINTTGTAYNPSTVSGAGGAMVTWHNAGSTVVGSLLVRNGSSNWKAASGGIIEVSMSGDTVTVETTSGSATLDINIVWYV